MTAISLGLKEKDFKTFLLVTKDTCKDFIKGSKHQAKWPAVTQAILSSADLTM